ncbi:MAG TPA: PAS domain-containing sensor histidine kinase [Gemmatimonadaceae bacterium]|nr:PAS domain-containing sensor histidine kinase [Gemmatimonadaceae bacterium]
MTTASGSQSDPHETEMLEAMEELRVADEELRAQNQELMESRQAIDRERLRYRELFDFAPDAYVVTDVHGTIREANVAAGKLLGIEPRFLVGKPVQAFFEEGSRRQYSKQLDQLCHSDRIEDWQLWITPRHGERKPVAVSLSRAPERDHHKLNYRWILRDISKQKEAEDALRELNRDLELRVASRTAQLAAANLKKDQLIFSERKAREEAEVANRVKSDFLALLSHEFRTPLQAIFGYTELLEREIHGPLNDAQLRDLKRIQQSQQHLLGLITTILDFARLESGRGMDVQLAPVVVHDVLGNMEGFIGPQLEAKGLSYIYRCEDHNLVANADAPKLEQILLNLLANAVKFTPSGGVITLECSGAADRVKIHVRDNGIGIPPEIKEKVFNPFFTTKPAGEGTGLGLSMSHDIIVKQHGGTIHVGSEPGVFTEFVVTLPRAISSRGSARRGT